MAKTKKGPKKDFQKVKLKVGKKLKKADNVTNTSFKSRAIQIAQQLKTKDGETPSTRKKQNISELLLQCRHYNSSVRNEAVTGLRELATSFPEVLQSNLADILEKSAELLTDKDPTVRQAVIRLFKSILPKISEKQISPFFPLVCAHLCCSMTHIYDDIRIHSLSILDLLLEHYPKLMVSKSSQVLSNFIEQISRQQGQGQAKRSLTTNPDSKISSLKWRTSVFNRLNMFLAAILQLHREGQSVVNDVALTSDTEVTFDTEKVTSVQTFPKSFRGQWENQGFTLSSSSVDQSNGNQSQGETLDKRFPAFVSTMIPLLLECWVECAPAQGKNKGAGNLIDTENLGLMWSILQVTQQLCACIGCLTKEQASDIWRAGRYIKDFQKHFLAHFPYCVHNPVAKADKKHKSKKDKQLAVQVTAETLNLGICDIMVSLLPWMSGQDVVQSGHWLPWLPDITQYLVSYLKGRYSTETGRHNCRIVVKVMDQLLLSGITHASVTKVIKSAYTRYQSANCLSQEKKLYLHFFAKTILDGSAGSEVVSSEIRESFLNGLPELLPLVVKNHPQMAALVIATMKTAACQNCTRFLDDKIVDWFNSTDGAMVMLPPCDQRSLIGLLYYLPDMEIGLLKMIASLVKCDKLGEPEVAYLIQVLQNRYLQRGQQSQDAILYLSFLSNLVIGSEQEEMAQLVASDSSGGQSIIGRVHTIFVSESTLDVAAFTRQEFIIKVVSNMISQCSNSTQISTVVCNVIETFLEDNKTIVLQVFFGIFIFAESLTSFSTSMTTLLTNLAISLVLMVKPFTNQSLGNMMMDLACSLVRRIPGCLECLLKEIADQVTVSRPERLEALLRVVLMFLKGDHKTSLRSQPACRTNMLSLVTVVNQTQVIGKEKLVPMETRRLLTEIEYLISMET